MRPDYKNWIPKGMLVSLIAGTVLSFALLLVFGVFGIGVSGKLRIALGVVFGIAFVICAKYTEWCVYAYRSFSYDGERKLSKQIIDGTASHITLPEGGIGLDVGCGSGILSIAALRLGAEHAFACDIDDKCVGVAYENAALNGIGREHYTVRAGDVLSDKRLAREFGGDYDIVVANIVADVIIGLSGQVRPFLKEGGLFLCSGIIDDRAEEVAQRLREVGWNILRTRQSEGWFSYLCR